MRICVTEEHINKGYSGSCEMCPIALALKEQMPDVNKVEVADTMIYLHLEEDDVLEKQHTRRTARFIEEFDQGKNVEPFYFYMEMESKANEP